MKWLEKFKDNGFQDKIEPVSLLLLFFVCLFLKAFCLQIIWFPKGLREVLRLHSQEVGRCFA